MNRMKKGFALTLMTVAIALIQVSTSHATAPVILDPGDVIIGDLEGIHGPATGSNIFVYPDAIDLDAIVQDDLTPDHQIKWSFTSDITGIRINGVNRLNPTLVGLDEDDPTSPRASSRLDLVNTDTGQPGDVEDGNPFTITFRNANLSPDNAHPYFGPTGFITSQTAQVTLFASDCGTFSQRTITVFAAQRSSDSISGGGPQLLATVDFAATTDGWIGGARGGFGGSTANGASGLCMTVPGPGSNDVLWVSPASYIELTAGTIYRVRTTASMSAPASPAADTIPLWFFEYDNSNLVGGLGNNYGGFSWVLDVDGDAQGIGRGNGRTQYDFWIAPNSVATPQWNAGGFTLAEDVNNDIRLIFEIIDSNAALLAAADAGTICISRIEISSALHDNLQGTTVYNPPIKNATHAVPANGEATQGTSSITDGTSSASIAVNTTGGNRQTLLPFDPLGDGVPGAQFGFAELYPVTWEANTLYRASVRIKAATSEADPIDAVFVVLDVTNSELGMEAYTTRGAPGGAMDKVASPKLAASTYEGYFFSQNATSSTVPNANRLRPQAIFFNTVALGGGDGSGGNAVIVDQLKVDKITNGIN